MCMVLHLNYKIHTKNDLRVLHPIPTIANCFCCKLHLSTELYYCSKNLFHLTPMEPHLHLIQLKEPVLRLNKQMHLSKHNFRVERDDCFHFQDRRKFRCWRTPQKTLFPDCLLLLRLLAAIYERCFWNQAIVLDRDLNFLENMKPEVK